RAADPSHFHRWSARCNDRVRTSPTRGCRPGYPSLAATSAARLFSRTAFPRADTRTTPSTPRSDGSPGAAGVRACHRIPRRVELADVDPVHAGAFGGVQVERAQALDGNLAAIALDARQRGEIGVEGERSALVSPLQADQELVPPYRRIADREHDDAVSGLAR